MESFKDYIIGTCNRLAEKFKKKNGQYTGAHADELANFRIGALMKYGKADMASMFEMAKDYSRKHVAYVESHGIDGRTQEDSLEDLAVYAMIMLYMRARYLQEHENDK